MKRLLTLLVLIIINCLLSTVNCNAQVFSGMNYQAVARDAGGAIMANRNICVHFYITNGNGGLVIYEDSANLVTNPFGLFTFNIGSSAPFAFSQIPWNQIEGWLDVQLDVNCTGTYTDMGTSQLLTVPYAAYAYKSSDNKWAENAGDIYNTTPGNVGIGTISPSTKLDVNGVITATGGNSDNWNTAYSWGDHSLAGYITSENDPKVGTLTDYYVPRWESGTLVNSSIFDNGFYVGIGTASPVTALDVNGAIHLGDYFGVLGGTIRAHNGDFEGYTVNGWTSFTQTKNQSMANYNFSSAVRNTYVYSPDSIVILENGTYLVSLNIDGHDDNIFTASSTDYDLNGTGTVIKVGYGSITHAVAPFQKYLDVQPVGYESRFVPSNASSTQIVDLYTGDVLKLGVYVQGVGSPTYNWYIDYYNIEILKLK